MVDVKIRLVDSNVSGKTLYYRGGAVENFKIKLDDYLNIRLTSIVAND